LRVKVDATSSPVRAAEILTGRDFNAEVAGDHLCVTGVADPAAVTRALADEQIYVSELVPLQPDLETVFLELTGTHPVQGRYPQVDDSIQPPPPGAVPGPFAAGSGVEPPGPPPAPVGTDAPVPAPEQPGTAADGEEASQ